MSSKNPNKQILNNLAGLFNDYFNADSDARDDFRMRQTYRVTYDNDIAKSLANLVNVSGSESIIKIGVHIPKERQLAYDGTESSILIIAISNCLTKCVKYILNLDINADKMMKYIEYNNGASIEKCIESIINLNTSLTRENDPNKKADIQIYLDENFKILAEIIAFYIKNDKLDSQIFINNMNYTCNYLNYNDVLKEKLYTKLRDIGHNVNIEKYCRTPKALATPKIEQTAQLIDNLPPPPPGSDTPPPSLPVANFIVPKPQEQNNRNYYIDANGRRQYFPNMSPADIEGERINKTGGKRRTHRRRRHHRRRHRITKNKKHHKRFKV